MRVRRTVPLALSSSFVLLACRSLYDDIAAERGTAAAADLGHAADQVELGIQQLNATVAALHTMVETPAADLATQRRMFEEALGNLMSTGEDVRAAASDILDEGRTYMAQWDQQLASIRDEDIRTRSADRRRELETSFAELEREYNDAKNAIAPLFSDLRDIRTALRTDLTAGGLAALQPPVRRVEEGAEAARKELMDLARVFRELGLDLSRAGPPARPAPREERELQREDGPSEQAG